MLWEKHMDGTECRIALRKPGYSACAWDELSLVWNHLRWQPGPHSAIISFIVPASNLFFISLIPILSKMLCVSLSYISLKWNHLGGRCRTKSGIWVCVHIILFVQLMSYSVNRSLLVKETIVIYWWECINLKYLIPLKNLSSECFIDTSPKVNFGDPVMEFSTIYFTRLHLWFW